MSLWKAKTVFVSKGSLYFEYLFFSSEVHVRVPLPTPQSKLDGIEENPATDQIKVLPRFYRKGLDGPVY